MKLYLSSYEIGDKGSVLREWAGDRTLGYVPNALDFTGADPRRRHNRISMDREDLRRLGIKTVLLDLQEFFGNEDALRKTLDGLGGVFVCGGNTFVLRQAMRLSGFDEFLSSAPEDFVYAGYSAAGCVLSPTLDGYDIVDDPKDLPYRECRKVIREGLSIIDFTFLPHFESDHPESSDIGREVAYCEENGMPYKTLRDGEVFLRP
jgi:dipeptidase E